MCFLELQCLKALYMLQNKVEGQLLFTNEGQFIETISFWLLSLILLKKIMHYFSIIIDINGSFYSNTSKLLPEKETTTITWTNFPKQSIHDHRQSL